MVFRQSKLLSILHGPEFDGQVKLESGMNSDVQPMKVAWDCLDDNWRNMVVLQLWNDALIFHSSNKTQVLAAAKDPSFDDCPNQQMNQ